MTKKPRSATARKRSPRSTLSERETSGRASVAEHKAGNAVVRAAEQVLGVQKSLLHAGLRALRIEAGETPGKGPWPLSSLEEVFDQRVASALQRLGLPDPSLLARLCEQVEQLQRQLDDLGKTTTR